MTESLGDVAIRLFKEPDPFYCSQYKRLRQGKACRLRPESGL